MQKSSAAPAAPVFTTRPVYMGTHGVVASGHYLAARAAQRMFDRGGNAIDAVVASGFAVNVLEPQSCGIGGEVPILVYLAKEKRVYSISGQGWMGQAATPDYFRKLNVESIPGDGFLPATVPAAFGTWAFALMRFGTLRLRDVLEPAIDYTASGFPVYPNLRAAIVRLAARFRDEWTSSAAIYLPNGRPPEVGEVLRNADWAATFKKVVEVETRESKRGREGAIQATIDWWYHGEVAEKLVTFLSTTESSDASGRKHRGLLSKEDFAAWKPKLEESTTVRYRGLDVYKCGPWTQGPVFLQQLRLLEGFDLEAMGHNSTQYIHTVLEASKLAFADRERFYADPDFVDVPLTMLLSAEYAAERRTLIDAKRSSRQLRPGHGPATNPDGLTQRVLPPDWDLHANDTTHTCGIDIQGNLIAATPSGGWIPSSPVVPGLGFPMGTRGQMCYLDPHHAGVVAPRKRPRTTLTPSLVLRDGQPWMVFGTPGGDQQDQWTLQFFLNHVVFRMNLQEAIDQPTFHSVHFPSSFYPHHARACGMVIESRVPEATRKELAARGHLVQLAGPWAHGKVMAVQLDAKHGVIAGAVSPRGQIGYVAGW